ncbi:MAG: metallophosphoesterase, partial [Candidatus Heimdallarchaeaceae archaeon]
EYYPNRPNTLVIPFLGDMVDNSIMRGNQRSNIELNTVDQVIYVTEIIVDYITALSKYFPKIKCYGIYGNHGRTTRSTTDSAPSENFDRVVYWAVKKRIENYKNVSFDYTDAQHMVINVNGWKFWLEHGDSVNSWAGIPFYGAKREKASIGEMMGIFKQYADYVLMGHHHQPAQFNGIFINGAFVGGDIFSIGKLRRMCLPSQTLLGVNKKHGIVWSRNISLIDNPRALDLKIYE